VERSGTVTHSLVARRLSSGMLTTRGDADVGLASSTGLLVGLEERLTADEFTLLENAIANMQLEVGGGKRLSDPGARVLKSYHEEDAVSDELREAFQAELAKLLRRILSGGEDSIRCCSYHAGQFEEIRGAVQRADAHWVLTFLNILAVRAQDLHFQFRSPLGADGEPAVLLSRFMPLSRFIEAHTSRATNVTVEGVFVDRLAPEFAPEVRREAQRAGDLGAWRGRIGTYPSSTIVHCASVLPYRVHCEAVKPFATLTDVIAQQFDRSGSPARVLRKLGIPFSQGSYWIELIYSSADVAFVAAQDKSGHLGIPTRLECGHWAFRPDRDAPPQTNYAVDFERDDRGLPELIHMPFDAPLLRDFIVWGQATEADWFYPDSPLVH